MPRQTYYTLGQILDALDGAGLVITEDDEALNESLAEYVNEGVTLNSGMVIIEDNERGHNA